MPKFCPTLPNHSPSLACVCAILTVVGIIGIRPTVGKVR